MRRKGTDHKTQLPSEAATAIAGGVTRSECIFVSAVLVMGIGLRVASLSRSAVEHFDEGVYASNIYFGGPEYAYPLQRFYAPPLLPALIEAGMIVGLPPNLAAQLPSFLAGCATIVALWWFGRSWFGAEAGLSVATLAALSDFHVTYSATALTDVLLGLWLVLAVDAIARSLLAGDFRWAALAGVYTGLAWWTKYNGWLPLAIEAAALLVLWLFIRPAKKQWLTWLGCFVVTTIVAAVVWSPYYLSLQTQGGYAPIAANHAKYMVGIGGWIDAAWRQISNQHFMEGILSVAGVVASIVLPGIFLRGNYRDLGVVLLRGLLAGGLAIFVTSFVAIGIAAVIGLCGAIVRLDRTKLIEPAGGRRAVGLALLLAWFGGLLLATPLYSAYPRLVLPGLCAAWIGAAIFAAESPANGLVTGAWVGRSRWPIAGLLCFLGAAGFLVMFVRPYSRRHPFEGDRRGVKEIARQIHASDASTQPRAVYVYGEPALLFQLRAVGEEVVAPIQEVPKQTGLPVANFLIVGPHADGDATFQNQWKAEQDRWELVKEYVYSPSAVVWLDLHDPREPAETSDRHRVRQYRRRQ